MCNTHHASLWLLPLSQSARRIWLGKWNSKRDREPDKADESAFKNFLIAKYERKSWYVDPKEALKEETNTEPKPEPKLNPPPSSKVGLYLSYIYPIV